VREGRRERERGQQRNLDRVVLSGEGDDLLERKLISSKRIGEVDPIRPLDSELTHKTIVRPSRGSRGV